ncbi:hypothetical protein B7R21_09855 [Subtercola boreus]|uniref:Uncharacterized protein n=1 Tax=Subtercola boreus TaxID=120213 RepID=A0A3E0VSF1_9MICO|nr:hypothetical protein [Subtercola boreus]RFA12641.1 hypothetical protein B7R21_09855 [Subtercola boreus]
MITATLAGRNLELTLDNIDQPFIIKPLPGRMGKQVTDHYLRITARAIPADGMEDLLRICVDGGRWHEDKTLVPLPEAHRTNYLRCEDELSTAEAQDVLLPALLWQTVLGMDGVTTYVDGGGGMAGGVAALRLLVTTLGISPHAVSPRMEELIEAAAGGTETTA